MFYKDNTPTVTVVCMANSRVEICCHQVYFELTGPAAALGRSGESSVAGLYVVGDLRSERPKQIYTAIADATTSADMINRKLRSAKEVTPCDLKDWKPCLEENSSTMKKNICTRMNDFARRTKKTISTFITRCFKSS